MTQHLEAVNVGVVDRWRHPDSRHQAVLRTSNCNDTDNINCALNNSWQYCSHNLYTILRHLVDRNLPETDIAEIAAIQITYQRILQRELFLSNNILYNKLWDVCPHETYFNAQLFTKFMNIEFLKRLYSF